MNTTVIVACLAIGMVGLAGCALANGMGPAPNSGDGVPDGPGWE